MTGDFTIDFGSALPYAVDTFMSLIGKDANSKAKRNLIEKQVNLSLTEASRIQCIGMDRPIALNEIYCATRLLSRRNSEKFLLSTNDFLSSTDNAVLFGGTSWNSGDILLEQLGTLPYL